METKMNIKLTRLIIIGIAAAPALAFADTSNVTVYGKVDLAFGSTSNGSVSNNQVSSEASRFGIKGSEYLGDGLSAIWKIESAINMDNAVGNGLATRNSFLGLKSDSAGTLLLGRHDTPYKIATRKLDVFADQIADNRHLMGGGTSAYKGSYMDMRPTNELVYLSPKIAGFKAVASYANGAEEASAAGQIKGSIWALAVMYDQGPFYGALAYQNVKYGTAATGSVVATGSLAAGDSLKAWKMGAGYKMDALQLNAVYEKISSAMGATGLNTLGRTDWYLAGKYSFGSDDNDVKLSYTRAGDTNGVASTGARMFGLGYDHNLSKRTSLYAQYNKLSNDAGAAFGFGTTTTASVTGIAGQSTSGFMLGMKHTF